MFTPLFTPICILLRIFIIPKYFHNGKRINHLQKRQAKQKR